MKAPREAERFLRGTDELEHAQLQILIDSILPSNRLCEFGKAHAFDSIHDPDEYRRRVPLSTYEDLRSSVDRMAQGETEVLTSERVIAFFKTSGTLSEPKLIPVTPSFMREKMRAFGIFWHLVNEDHPAVAGGRVIANFGDAGRGETTPGGREATSETSFWNRRMQMFQQRSAWPLPPAVRQISDPDLRYFVVARLAMQGPLHCVMCLNPSTLLRLCRTIELHHSCLIDGLRSGKLSYPGRAGGLADSIGPFLRRDVERASDIAHAIEEAGGVSLPHIWPELELAICWQSDLVEPYLRLVRKYLPGIPFRDYITQASECIMAIPTGDAEPGGPLAYRSHFFEFVPERSIDNADPETLLAGELEVGEIYEVVCTTSAGLYRYRMGDCVRVKGFRGRVPEIEFLYRHGSTASITGEKLTEYQLMDAVRHTTADAGVGPGEFICFPRSGRDPHYAILMTWPGSAAETKVAVGRWVRRLDERLRCVNTEYGGKRGSGRLGRIIGLLTTPAGFDQYRRQLTRQNASEEQTKIGGLSRTVDLDRNLPGLREIDADRKV